MSDDGRILSTSVIAGALLGLLCCAAPLLVAILLTDLTAQFASTGRVLTAALVVLVAAMGFLLHRQWTHDRRSAARRDDGAPASDDFCSGADGALDGSTR